MNVDDDNTKPVTDLRLSLGFYNQLFKRILDDHSGAGANAVAPGKRSTFIGGEDPLSELVWSPRKGLRIKCTDRSSNGKVTSLLWGPGPTRNILAKRNTTIYKIMDNKVIKSTALDSSRSISKVMPVCSTPGHGLTAGNVGNMEDMNTAVEACVSDMKGDHPDNNEKGKYLHGYVPVDDVHNNREDTSSSPDESQSSRAHMKATNSDSNAGREDVRSGNKNLDIEDVSVSQNNSVGQCRASDTPMLNQQFLALFTGEEIKSNMERIGSTGMPLENVELTDENDLHAMIDENVTSPTHNVLKSKSECERQDEDIMVGESPTRNRIPVYRNKGKEKALSDGAKKSDEDDNDKSHESVESCNGAMSKGIKRYGFEQQMVIGTKRVKKQSQENPGASSFMSWISNMMKVFPKPINEETPTVSKSNQEQQIDITFKKKEDHERRNMGFQNIFKSLYSCDPKARTMNFEFQTSNELDLATDVCAANVTPIACHGPSDVNLKQYLLTNESDKTHSKENNVVCNLASDVEKDGPSPACSSHGKRKAISIGSDDYIPAAKARHSFNKISDPRGSLWITRFCQKPSGPTSKLDHGNSKEIVPHFLNPLGTSSKDRNLDTMLNSVTNNELESCGANSEASFGLRKIKGDNDDHPATSKIFKRSEAMASIFARRLNALKHILHSDAAENVTTSTCFFCGKTGHDVRDCSEVTESELDDLLKSIYSYDGAEKCTCLCIRCFQLNHWAVSCPSVSSRKEKSERGTMDTGLNLNQKAQNLIPPQNFFSENIGGNVLKEKPGPSYIFVSGQISDVPKGISNAIKKLRLSRTDIFKCMNSQVPLSHLTGFFLRLRLGKWEGEPRGTGYYVGCINGAQRVNAPKCSKNPISVMVGGIECLVESKYVSNQDFLEEELTAWWSETAKSGGKVPSEEEMKEKLEEKMKIGF